jgi:DNA-directed RNA polymerase subunit RPC12/RpoP
MAENTDPSPAADSGDALRKRIAEYIASPQAAQHVQEGFYQAGGISPTLNQFRERESRRQRQEYEALLKSSQPQHSSEEELRQGLQASSSVKYTTHPDTMRCLTTQGHRWNAVPVEWSPDRAEDSYVCLDCGITRAASVSPPKAPPMKWPCFYCSAEFENEDSLLDHEDDCAEA